MLAWVIDALNSYLAKGPAGELELALTLFVPIASAVIAITFAASRYAQRRYRKDIATADELRQQVAARDETIRERDKRLAVAAQELQAAHRAGALGYLEDANKEQADGNFGREVELSEKYLERNRPALHRAFTTLMNDALVYAAEEGATGFENARLFALAGFAVDRGDEDMWELAQELGQAAAVAAGGARVALKSKSARVIARRERAELPEAMTALQGHFNEAIKLGHYQLAVAISEQGFRLASRAGGKHGTSALLWGHQLLIAEGRAGHLRQALAIGEDILPHFKAMTNFGPYHAITLSVSRELIRCIQSNGEWRAAVEASQQLSRAMLDHFGENHAETYRAQDLEADCLEKAGDHSGALALALQILPVGERLSEVTLGLRYTIASCHHELEKSEHALEEALELRKIMDRRYGPKHPDIYAVRNLIGLSLRDLGREDEALLLTLSLLPEMEATLGSDHHSTIVVRHLNAWCLRATGDPQGALPLLLDLLSDSERVTGSFHPHTLAIKTLLADTYLDLGQRSDALAIHHGNVERLLASGIPPTHRFIPRARAVDERLAEEASAAALGDPH